jgi:hypothetical protein
MTPFWVGFASAIVSIYGVSLFCIWIAAKWSPVVPQSAVEQAGDIARAAARDEAVL